MENTTGLLSLGWQEVLGDIAAFGYDAEWDVIPAAAIGAPHIRDRIFIVAYPSGESGSFGIFHRDGGEEEGRYLSPQKWCQDRNFLEMGSSPDRRVQVYEEGLSFPDFPLLVDGLPERLEQIRQYGNAIVPQVAEWLGNRIMEFA